MNKYILSIIIVNWNVSDLILDLLQSIEDNPPSGYFEIIIIDNASADNGIINIRKKYPSVKVIENNENLGFGKANNQGIEVAKGKYILLLNPDTIVIEDALDQLINVLENNPNFGMVGPQLLNSIKDGDIQQGCARLTRTFISGVVLDLLYVQRVPYLGPKLVKKLRYPYDLTRECFVEAISGAAMLFSASTIQKIGGFNEKFFMCGEDLELCDRFRASGLPICYYPKAKVIHINQSCTPKNPIDIFVNRFLSVAKYYELKNGYWPHFLFRILTYIIFIPNLSIKAFFYLLRNNYVNYNINIEILKKLLKWRFVGDAQNFN